jgi:hypothetical protein
MAEKKYISLSKLSTFLDNLKEIFSPLVHTHKISDLTDYIVDSELSSASTNPVQNSVINAELDEIAHAMGALELAIDSKADADHTHDNIKQSDWAQTDESAIDFIKNKPDEDDAMELMLELDVVAPAAADDGSLYTDEDGVIYTLN